MINAQHPLVRGAVVPTTPAPKGTPNTIASIMDAKPYFCWFYDENGNLTPQLVWETIDGYFIDPQNGPRFMTALRRMTPAIAAAFKARVEGKGAEGELPQTDAVDVIGG
jgi:hypothetical protein